MLSTLHTNDAPGALSRLTEMGVEPFLTASAVDCVIAQRLVRKLCEYCREPYPATREMLERLGFPQRSVEKWKDITAPQGGRLRPLQRHRLQGPSGHLRDHAGHRGPRKANRRAQERR